MACICGTKFLLPILLTVLLSSFIICTLGKLECEDLLMEECAFSVSSSGARCVLEKYIGNDNVTHIECQSSIILAENQEEWIESDECVRSCGLERISFGLSTDLLLDSQSTAMLCSPECVNNCPNIIDLYINLAAGEGLYLPQLCKSPRMISRRSMVDPIKLAKEHAQYMSSLHLSSLRNGGVLSPNSFRGESGEGFGGVIGVSAPQPSPAPMDAPTYDQTGNSQPINIAGSPTAAPARTPSGQWSRSHASSLQPGAPVGSPGIQPGSMIIPAPSPSPSTTEADTYAPSPVLVEAVTPTSEYLPVFAADSEDELDDKDLMYESYFI